MTRSYQHLGLLTLLAWPGRTQHWQPWVGAIMHEAVSCADMHLQGGQGLPYNPGTLGSPSCWPNMLVNILHSRDTDRHRPSQTEQHIKNVEEKNCILVSLYCILVDLYP